jgi:hypothetical protein
LSGTTTDENEQLKICASVADNMDFSIFNNLVAMLNGRADFELFRLLIFLQFQKSSLGKPEKLKTLRSLNNLEK